MHMHDDMLHNCIHVHSIYNIIYLTCYGVSDVTYILYHCTAGIPVLVYAYMLSYDSMWLIIYNIMKKQAMKVCTETIIIIVTAYLFMWQTTSYYFCTLSIVKIMIILYVAIPNTAITAC